MACAQVEEPETGCNPVPAQTDPVRGLVTCWGSCLLPGPRYRRDSSARSRLRRPCGECAIVANPAPWPSGTASSLLPWPQCVKFDERLDTCNSSETLLIVRIRADLLHTMCADARPLYRSLTDSESYAAASAQRPASPPPGCGRRAL